MSDRKEKLVLCLDDLEEQTVEWLWPGRLPVAKLTLIDGDPSQGKSLMTLDLAGRLTVAAPLPDGYSRAEPISVVLVGSEDGVRDTVLPRLRAAGADLRRVHVFAGRARAGVWSGFPSFPDDCDLLSETLAETSARLVIVDPLMAFLSSRVSSVNDQMVRQALGPLAQVAEERRAAIVLVRHLTKGSHGNRALYRGSGSIAIVGAARMAYLVGAHTSDEDLHVLACTKSNLITPPTSLCFRIAANSDGQPVLTWSGSVDLSADELLLGQRLESGQALKEAKAFLEEQLREGPRAQGELSLCAQQAGVSEKTLRRAKAVLGVLSEQKSIDGRSCWFWRLAAASSAAAAPAWPDDNQRALEQAQKQSDELMARIRDKYVYAPARAEQSGTSVPLAEAAGTEPSAPAPVIEKEATP